jgi:hypothetical protein
LTEDKVIGLMIHQRCGSVATIGVLLIKEYFLTVEVRDGSLIGERLVQKRFD